MSHGPTVEWKKDNASASKTKLGVIMVLIYTFIYAGFIFINVAMPKVMKIDIGGVNVAIVYGFGLIILALVQAVIYNHICTRAEEKAEKEHNALMEENEI